MNMRWSLGTFRGIPISLHWSLILVFTLLTSSLAGRFLADENAGLSPGETWLVAAVTGVLFFVSILLHEIGHAWVAQRNGLPVKGITLFIFGGVAQIEKRMPSAGVEFRVAAAGPLVTGILAAFFYGVHLTLGGISNYLDAPAAWLAWINMLLLLFNLIPGYPLDGGRILRSAVWYFSRNERTATRTAGITGQLAAFAFFGWGLYTIFSGNVIDGVWLMFIGWFIQNAAASETMMVSTEQALEGITVGQAMRRDLPTVSSRARLRQIVEGQVIGRAERVFIVVDEDDPNPRGLLTLDHIARVPRQRWDWAQVCEIMTPWRAVFHLRAEMELMEALKMMDERGVTVAAVTEDGRLAGLFSREQLAIYLQTAPPFGSRTRNDGNGGRAATRPMPTS